MLVCNFAADVIILLTFPTKMCILCHTINFSRFWWYFGAILAKRSFGLLFFIGINDIVDDIDG